MKDITDRYELHLHGYAGVHPSNPHRIVGSTTYCWIMVEKAKGLSVAISKPTASANWPYGQIKFSDDENEYIASIAQMSETSASEYRTFALDFPKGSTRAWVNSSMDRPPKVFKKVM